ncbi:Gamma carbonic anhydrase [Seminavis robusta]|uniref:Gamma carbonic anhydrase n=1 Tax=Seminavis robusta TaxID=568900 RepID=A0A9N8HIM8_9STRA|nr:Gamma carbonic anhydrase [Seminavis robusta]|eukprot:Sro796_g203670.1 Gamma carbonic anhydrase (242) ;mRNA; f:8707-9543
MSQQGISKVVGQALRETGTRLRQLGADEIFTRHRPRMFFNGKMPWKTNDTFIAPNASVIGDVTNWDRSSVWYDAVVRADSTYPIEIGYCSSIGEGSVVSTLPAGQTLKTGFAPETFIGHYVTVGAGCVLKSCRIDDLVEIGDKCTIMEGAIVENNTKLEPGTVVPAYGRIPKGQLWGGNPAKYVRELTESETDINRYKNNCKAIHAVAYDHMVEFLPVGSTYMQLEELEEEAAAAEAKKAA